MRWHPNDKRTVQGRCVQRLDRYWLVMLRAAHHCPITFSQTTRCESAAYYNKETGRLVVSADVVEPRRGGREVLQPYPLRPDPDSDAISTTRATGLHSEVTNARVGTL